jgi:hypothetical protein
MRKLPAAAALLALGLAGCSTASPPAAAPPTHHDVAPAVASSSSAPAPAPSQSPTLVQSWTVAAAGATGDGQGDVANVTILLGTPVPLSHLSRSAVSPACGSGSPWSQPGQVIAVPVGVSATMATTQPSQEGELVGVQLSPQSLALGLSDTDPPPGSLWGQSSLPGVTGSCSGEGGGLDVSWANLLGSAQWSGWLFLPAQYMNSTVFGLPTVQLGTTVSTTLTPQLAKSGALVNCGSAYGTFIAVNIRTAVREGCPQTSA